MFRLTDLRGLLQHLVVSSLYLLGTEVGLGAVPEPPLPPELSLVRRWIIARSYFPGAFARELNNFSFNMQTASLLHFTFYLTWQKSYELLNRKGP